MKKTGEDTGHITEEDMIEKLNIVFEGGEGEIVEKKSRFICTIKPVESEEEATAFIAEIRKKYWDARHHCSAFTIGEKHEISRCSDDGEPAQTAGRPMLDVLLGRELHNVCAVVTRYFGGTLLGTGGLVRAYSGAVQEGLKNCVVLEKCLAYKLKITTDYSGLGKIQYILAEAGISILNSDYAEGVVITALIPVADIDYIEKKLIEGTNGRAGLERDDQVWYGVVDGEVLILD